MVQCVFTNHQMPRSLAQQSQPQRSWLAQRSARSCSGVCGHQYRKAGYMHPETDARFPYSSWHEVYQFIVLVFTIIQQLVTTARYSTGYYTTIASRGAILFAAL